jgi:prepilin-type N-terminal cleavage/methylation domain-containing protein
MSRGFTLLEVMVTVVLMGVLAGITGLAVRSLEPGPGSAILPELQGARAEAIMTGEPRVWTGRGIAVRFDPDGSSSGGRVESDGAAFTIDPVSGEIREVP